MKMRLLALLVPGWLACGEVVDLGPVEGDRADGDPVTDTEFEPAVVELAPWRRGMCSLFSDESVRCWHYGNTNAWLLPGVTGIALSTSCTEVSHSRVCALQRSGSVICVANNCEAYVDIEEYEACGLDTPPFEITGFDLAVDLLPNADLAVMRSDATVQRIRDFYTETSFDLAPPELFDVGEPITAADSFGNFVTASGHVYSTTIQYESGVIEQYRILPSTNPTWPPLPVPTIDDGVAIRAAGFVNYVIRGTGSIVAWGWIPDLGIGREDLANGSGEVVGIDDAVAVDSNGSGACAIRSDRSLWCWGYSSFGNLGFPGGIPGDYDIISLRIPTPLQVPGIDNVRAVVMGDASTCVVRGTNEVSCWGWRGDRGEPSPEPYRIHFR